MTAPLTVAGSRPVTPSTRPLSQWFEVHPDLGISLMDHLYNRLDGAYPQKWRANFPSQQSIDNWCESWVEAFEEEGVTPADVRVGLKECRRRFTWPPSCAEFIQACKPFTDPAAAYHEAVAGLQARGKGELGVWSHPAVFWAASGLSRDLMEQTFGQVKDRWASALGRQLARGTWEDIPPPRLQLPAPGKGVLSKENAERFLREVGAAGVLKRDGDGSDPKGWARRIMQRVAAGDKRLMHFQISAAEEALGLRARTVNIF
jgi:hypothetical protein